MKQANFDVAHELDEFLLAEKPLTHTKRKANPDLEKRKPELRLLEEQYVLVNPLTYKSLTFLLSSPSFILYDFSRMTRTPYDPLNGGGVGTYSGGTDRTLAQSATGTINPVATVLEHSRAGSTDSADRPPFGRPSITHSTTRISVQPHPTS
jgi:serine/threonine kinase 32